MLLWKTYQKFPSFYFILIPFFPFLFQVTEVYDEIVDSKNSLGLALSQKGLINFHHNNSGSPLAKRARLDVNYSISPATSVVQNLGHHQQQNQQQHQNRRKMQLVNRIAWNQLVVEDDEDTNELNVEG